VLRRDPRLPAAEAGLGAALVEAFEDVFQGENSCTAPSLDWHGRAEYCQTIDPYYGGGSRMAPKVSFITSR
jgi:hypothetical protein